MQVWELFGPLSTHAIWHYLHPSKNFCNESEIRLFKNSNSVDVKTFYGDAIWQL